MPRIKTLESDFKLVTTIAGDQKRHSDGDQHQENLWIMRCALPDFIHCFAKKKRQSQGEKARDGIVQDRGF